MAEDARGNDKVVEDYKRLFLEMAGSEYDQNPKNKTLKAVLERIKKQINFLQFVQKDAATRKLPYDAHKIGVCVNLSLNNAIRTFPDKLQIWEEYLKFLQNFKLFFCPSLPRVLDQMLEINKGVEVFYKLAATAEYTDSHSMARARQYFIRGLRVHKKSRLLYLEWFKLELENIRELSRKGEETRARLDQAPMDIDNPNRIIINESRKKAGDIYELAMREVKDVGFAARFLMLTEKIDLYKSLTEKILKDLTDNHASDELSFDIRARHELKTRLPLKDRITRCIKVYTAGVDHLDTERMWKFYLNSMLSLNKDVDTKQGKNKDLPVLPRAKRNALLRAFAQGLNKKKISPEHYLKIANTVSKDDEKTLILKKGTKHHTNNVDLWLARLRFHLSKKSSESLTILDEATEKLGDDSVPLWKCYIQSLQLNADMASVHKFFEESIERQSLDVSNSLKPMFIEWITLMHGINTARRKYDFYARKEPFCLKLHLKMLQLEKIQAPVNLDQMRRCYKIITEQFGFHSIQPWILQIEFEKNNGCENLVKDLHDKALQHLDDSLHDEFESEFRLLNLK